MANSDRARIRALERQVALLQSQNAKLMALVEKLEARLRQNSTNSSMPPSSDLPKGKSPGDASAAPNDTASSEAASSEAGEPAPSGRGAAGDAKTTKRTAGGQVGHQGAHRPLEDASKVDRFHDHFPASCERCEHPLAPTPDANATRVQQLEMPPIRPQLHEHRLHGLTCACGHVTRATMPKAVPRGLFGVRLLAILATLTGSFRLSKRNTQRLLSTVLGVDASVGAISAAEGRVSDALQAPYDAAVAFAQAQPVAHADETSWRERRKRTWLWTLTTASVAIFMLQSSRGAEHARRLLGGFRGILVSDRFKSYGFVGMRRRQVCWAHLERDFTALAEARDGSFAQVAGAALIVQIELLWKAWHQARDGTLTRAQFQRAMKPIQTRIRSLLREGARSPCLVLRGKTKDIWAHRDALFTFVRHADVPPTNNAAERAVRHAVILRKTSFGTHSEAGSRFIERILTVHETLRIQERNVVEFIADAIEARLAGTPPPSLIVAT